MKRRSFSASGMSSKLVSFVIAIIMASSLSMVAAPIDCAFADDSSSSADTSAWDEAFGQVRDYINDKDSSSDTSSGSSSDTSSGSSSVSSGKPGTYMTGIDMREWGENPESGKKASLLEKTSMILSDLVTYVGLPIAIIFVIWKIVVVGFCTLIGVSPDKYVKLGGRNASSSADESDKKKKKKKKKQEGADTGTYGGEEVRRLLVDTVKGLLIVFFVWGIIEIAMKAVFLFVSMGSNFSASL